MESASLQDAMRLGKATDLYYYTSENTKKASIPTVVDNRFYQALTTLGAGSSTFIISQDQGVSDIILSLRLPPQGLGPVGIDYTGLALPRGWIYNSILRTSIRYGSSSQYFWTSQQMLVENLREMPNPETRDEIYELGGALMTQVSDFAGDNLEAFAYLNFPHNSPNGSLSKPAPFPSELIGSPIVVTVELNPLQSIFSSSLPGGDVSKAPTAYESGYFQVKMVHANDAGKLMAMPGGRGVAYSFPTKGFYQNEVDVIVGSPANVVDGPVRREILLTGFRNGEVTSIFFWVTKNSDTSPNRSQPFALNTTNFILPKDVELLYNGTVFYRTFGSASQMFSLISSETPSRLECTVLSLVDGVFQSATKKASWTEVPFAQVYEPLSGSHMYVAGKLIQNAVVNLSITLPDSDAYTVRAVYAYNCVLMISDRACEYAF